MLLTRQSLIVVVRPWRALAVGCAACCLGSTPQYSPTALAMPSTGNSWLAEIRREGCREECLICGLFE
jgi:hypothetical protein